MRDPPPGLEQTGAPELKLFTIGFTEITAEEFSTSLRRAAVKRVIEVRLNNKSQSLDLRGERTSATSSVRYWDRLRAPSGTRT